MHNSMSKKTITKLIKIKPVLLHLIVFSFVILVSVIINSPSVTLITAGILYTLFPAVIIFYEKLKTKNFFTPISMLFTYSLLSYGVAAVHIGIKLSAENSIQFVNLQIDQNYMETGYLLNLLGLFALHAGLNKFRPKHLVIIKNRISVTALLLLYFGGLFVILSPYLAGILGGFFVSFLPWLPVSVLLYIVLNDPQNLNISQRRRVYLIYILTIVLATIQIFSLSKLNVLISLLPLVWYHLLKSRINFKFLTILGLVLAFYLLFLQPYITYARIFYYEVTIDKLITDFIVDEKTRELILNNEFSEIISSRDENSSSSEIFIDRLFESTATAFVVKVVEESGLKYGETFQSIVWGLVPRILWQDKPDVSTGVEFTRFIGVDYSSATGMTTAGELYWNFGHIGVAFGLFIIGLLYAGLWRMVGTYPQNSFLGVWLYLLIFNGMVLHPEAAAVFLGIIQLYIFFSLLYYIRKLYLSFRFQPQISQ
jgi:hypothetical protein